MAALTFTVFACKVQHLAGVEGVQHRLTDTVTVAPGIAQMIDPYKSKLDAEMKEVIGQVAEQLIKAQPESGLGNLVADAMLHFAKSRGGIDCDFAVQNYGGIRIPSIQPGPLTREKVFELMPFDNRLVRVAMDSAMVQRFVAHIAKEGGWPVSKTLRFQIHPDGIKKISIGGIPLSGNQYYQVALPDYVADGGSDCEFLKDLPQIDMGILIRDAIVLYVKEKKDPIHANIDGRIVIVNQ